MKSLMIAVLLSPALLCAQGGKGVARMPEKSLKYAEGSYFTVTLPAGWEKRDSPFGLPAGEKKVYGVEVFGPAGAEGIVCRLSVHYYAPGNLLYKTMEKYIKRHAQPALGANIDGKQYGKVKNGEVAGHGARLFERITYEYTPSEAIDQKKVAVYEHFAVVPAKAGFYVLKYYAPKNIARANIKAFEAVLGSFVPLAK